MSIVKYTKETCDPCNPGAINQHNNAAIPTTVRPSITSCDKLCGENVAGQSIVKPSKPEGTPLKTKAYYNQVLDAGDTQHNVDTGLNPVFQRLAKIIDMTLYMPDSMENTVNDQGVTVLSGSGVIHGQFVPHVGDVFIYNMQGADYLFRIGNVRAMNSSPSTNYTVDFKASNVVTPGDALLVDLESKTTDVDTYRYVGARLTVGMDPILPNTVAAQGATLLSLVDRLTCYWRNTYYHKDSATHSAVIDGKSYYDPHVVNFMDKITSAIEQYTGNYNVMWRRNVSTSHINEMTIYEQLLIPNCGMNGISTTLPKMYAREVLSGIYTFNYLKFTPVNFLVSMDSFTRNATGKDLKEIPTTTIFGSDTVPSKYVVGNVVTPTTAFDGMIAKLMNSAPLSVSDIQAVDVELLATSVADRYWTIPLLIAGTKLLINQTGK